MFADVVAGLRLQGWLALRTPTVYMVLVTIPFYTAVFLAIVADAGRPDLFGAALVAPVLVAAWGMAIWTSGSIVRGDRWLATLEPTLATPASYTAVLFARILVVTAVSLVSVVEVWLTARLGFGMTIAVPHPWVLAATLTATAAAMAGTATVMSSLFVLSRVANTIQSSVSYPFYVLGGVFVPVALLPGWVRPISRLVFLSWSSDLLRDSLSPAIPSDVPARLAVVFLLGAAGYVGGWFALREVIDRVRSTGELGLR